MVTNRMVLSEYRGSALQLQQLYIYIYVFIYIYMYTMYTNYTNIMGSKLQLLSISLVASQGGSYACDFVRCFSVEPPETHP